MVDILGRTKGCHLAFYKAYPDAAAVAAAFQLLLSSLPPHWRNIVSTMPTALKSYNYILAKFTGGSNQTPTSTGRENGRKG